MNPDPQNPHVSRSARREQAALDALRSLCRDAFLERFGPATAQDADMPLTLRFKARAGEPWTLDADPPLRAQLDAQFDEIEAGRDAYRDGAMYCFRCGSSTCEHAAAPSPLSVFQGYSPMGIPEWCELTQYLIDAKDEEVDRLYARPPALLVRVYSGKDLRTKQLSSYGRSSKTYAVLGQVLAGYFVLAGEAREATGGDRLALTLQAVETRDASGLVLKLNVLAGLPGGVTLPDLTTLGWAPWVHRATVLADKELQRMAQRVRDNYDAGRPVDARKGMRGVPAVLNRLARSLERGGGQSRRRTAHAEQRRADHRPVHKAMDDLTSADPGQFYRDEKAGTYVIRGEQGRTHVFSAEGKHVTSLSLRPAMVATRVRTRRWTRVAPDEAEALRGRWLAQNR